jgi:hypothetical protein
MAAAVSACDSGTSPELSSIKIQLKDAPTEVIANAEVWISRIYLQGGGEDGDSTAADSLDTGGRVDVFNDSANPFHVDLLTLQDGITADVTDAVPVNAGSYQSLRFIVDSAKVTLVEGVTFEDGTNTAALFVPSGSQSGIKVKLDDIIDAQEGETTTILVDFDVEASFVIQGQSSPNGIRGILMNPVLKEANRQVQEG